MVVVVFDGGYYLGSINLAAVLDVDLGDVAAPREEKIDRFYR